MRIAVSGTHFSGKSTLVSALEKKLEGYSAMDEPYFLLEQEGYNFSDPPVVEDFEEQFWYCLDLIEESGPKTLFDRSPLDFLAYAMAILMFSMSGIPPAAGFFGKLIVFNAAVAEGYYILATLGILTSVVAAYYYLRIIKVMFFDDPANAFDGDVPFARQVVLFVSIVFVLGFVVKPSVFIESSMHAASLLFAG